MTLITHYRSWPEKTSYICWLNTTPWSDVICPSYAQLSLEPIFYQADRPVTFLTWFGAPFPGKLSTRQQGRSTSKEMQRRRKIANHPAQKAVLSDVLFLLRWCTENRRHNSQVNRQEVFHILRGLPTQITGLLVISLPAHQLGSP